MANSKYSPLKRFWSLLSLDKRDITQILSYAVFAGLVNLSLPLGIQAIVNFIQLGEVSTSWIILIILVVLGVGFVGVLQLMQLRLTEDLQQKIFTRSSFEFAYRLPKIKFAELFNAYPPELTNRFFDTLSVQKGISKILIDFSSAILQIIFGIALLSFYHPFFIFYGIILIALVFMIFKYTAPKGLQTSLEESNYKYKIAHWLQEIARSVNSFKLSGKTSLALGKNDTLTTGYLKARESHFKVLVLQLIQLIGFKILVTAGLLIIGGLLVLNQQMNIGQFVAAEIIILLIMASVEKLILGLETLYDVLTSLEKIGQVVDLELESHDGEEAFPVPQENLKLSLANVSFTYPLAKEKALKNINLTIESTDRICIVGDNESGKTTLLRVLAGLLEPQEGNFLVNGNKLQTLQINSYRANLGSILAGESPFEGTLLENITFNNPSINKEKVTWALEKMKLTQYVNDLEKGLNSSVYPEGKQLPLSVAKKIMLARSIVHNPKLLLLKNSLEHVGEKDCEGIIDFLTSHKNHWALVVVSSNPYWAKRCNKIITIDKGEIVSVKTNKK